MLKEITDYILIGIVATAAWAPILINLLYKFNLVVQHRLMPGGINAEFMKLQTGKSGTPAMGGLMISVTVLVLAVIFVPNSNLKTVFMIGWVFFLLYGLADGLLVYARKLSNKFRLLEESFLWRLGKLFLLYVLCVGAVLMVRDMLGVTSLNLFNLVTYNFNLIGVLFGSFIIAVAIYGIEITDGADGLVTGQFLVNLSLYLVICSAVAAATGMLPFLALTLGSALVYLYFNINPARVFMGGTGTFPIAFTLVLAALVSNTFEIFLIMGIMYWIEVASSAIQILSIRFFGRKVFRIAPIHHHFQAIGWGETKMVQRFWLASIVFALLALWVFTKL